MTSPGNNELTHWGRVTHICVSKITIIGSDNGLSPDRRQAIIYTNAGLLSIGPSRAYFSENLIKIQQFSSTKMQVKMSSAKWRPSCLGLNVLTGNNLPGLLCICTIALLAGIKSGMIPWPSNRTWEPFCWWLSTWASCQIRKFVGCACAGNAKAFSPDRGLAIPTCLRHVRDARAVMHAGVAN